MICHRFGTDKKSDKSKLVGFFGRGGRTRTHDPWFWRPVLYQLSYTPMHSYIIQDKIRFVKVFSKNSFCILEIFFKKVLTFKFLCGIIGNVLREWRNWQTRTFEGRVVLPYGFDSRFPHQKKTQDWIQS